MKYKGIILLLAALFASVTSFGQCEILIWEDDFNSGGLRTDYWNVELDNSGGGNDELQYYTPRESNVYIENGNLVLKALEEDFQGRTYTSGKVTTKGFVDWRYGRIEASIKLPEGRGIWPAFWMMPTESKYGIWPNSGEIDIMELIGSVPNTVYGTIHYGPPWNYTNGIYTLDEGKFSDDFHSFSIEWAPDSIKWYVDNDLYSMKTADSLRRPDQWKVFQERFYVILNLAVGGNWPGNPDETTVFPQTMEIDYVRVYGDPQNLEIIAVDSAYANSRGVRYTFNDIPGATFTWTVPEGATIREGQGTHSIQVDWGCDPGEISLQVGNIACGDQVYSCQVEFADLSLEGPDHFFPLSEATYTAPDLAGTSYTWSLPGDVTVLEDQGDTLMVKWGCQEGTVRVDAENACASLADSIRVSLDEPMVYGPRTVSENKIGVVYRVDPVPSSTFTWSVPSDAVITDGQGTDSIMADFGIEPGTVSVEISNQCYTTSYDLEIRITDTIILADYESTITTFEGWSGTLFEEADNPAPDDVNPSPHVGKTFKTEVAWSGIYTDLGYNLDMTRHKKFMMKVLGPKEGVILLKLEDDAEGEVAFQEIPADYTEENQWQELEFIFPDAVSGAFDRVTLFFDFGSQVENFFYFDDILLVPYENGSSLVNDLKNGDFRVYPNPFTDQLFIETNGGKAKVVLTWYTLDGRSIASSEITSGFQKEIKVDHIPPGAYILRISGKNREYREMVIKR